MNLDLVKELEKLSSIQEDADGEHHCCSYIVQMGMKVRDLLFELQDKRVIIAEPDDVVISKKEGRLIVNTCFLPVDLAEKISQQLKDGK